MSNYYMIKVNDTRNRNNRINWYYETALQGDFDWPELEGEAQAICEARGWSLINIRPVPEDAALERIEAQQRKGPGG